MPHTNIVAPVPNRGWDARILAFANPPLVTVFVIVTQRYLVVVDTLINPATMQQVMDAISSHLPGRQLLVINTHADYDHAWGNQLFAGESARYPAPILAHRRGAELFAPAATRDLLREFQAREPDIFGPVRLTPPTILCDGDWTIDGGDLTLQCLHTPGHRPDHIAIYIPEIATLLAADAAEWPFPFAASPADLPALRASLTRLIDLRPRHALYCHAPVECGPALLEVNRAYFDTLEAACHAGRACPVEMALPIPAGWPAPDAGELAAFHAEQVKMMLDWVHGRAA